MLNREQQKAVLTTEGPIRIIAGPGTGKTHTLFAKISYLIKEKGVKPEKILTIVTSNKAAHTLNKKLLDSKLPTIQALTFPGLAAKILRRNSDNEFKIITQKESSDLMDMILNADEKAEKKDVQMIREAMKHKSKRLINKANISEERLHEIITEFDEALAEKNGLDHAGLLTSLLELWSDKPVTAIACQNLYQYILVDNYHDLSAIQIEIVTRLSKTHENLCVVGDPDQTICSFRGAKTDTMSFFERQFPNAKSIALTKNYRNSDQILKGVEALISNNVGRLKKPIISTCQSNEKISLHKASNEEDQHHLISSIVAEQLKTHKPNEIAVITRGNSELKQIQEFLLKRGYPCQSSLSDSFWGKQEIIDFLDGIESLSHWTNIRNDQKFSHWIAEKIQKFIKAHQFSEAAISNLNQLVNCAKMHDHLPTTQALGIFLDESRTYHDADNLIFENKISIIDYQSVRGLEFPVVIVTDLDEDKLPHNKLKNEPYWLAEERRLLYVGMTRARESVHLITQTSPSRFLREISEENMKRSELSRVTISEINEVETVKSQMELF